MCAIACMWIRVTLCRYKFAVALNVGLTAADLGSILVVLLTVFSSMRAPEGVDRPRLRREAAFAIASIFLTLAGFAISVFGMARVLRSLRAAMATVHRSTVGVLAGRGSVAVFPDGPPTILGPTGSMASVDGGWRAPQLAGPL